MPAIVSKIVQHPHRYAAFAALLIVFATIPLSGILVVKTINDRNSQARAQGETLPPDFELYQMPVLSLRYLPLEANQATESAQIMDATTSAVPLGTTVGEMRSKIDNMRDMEALSRNKASKYHGYRDPNAQPSLNYTVLDDKEFLKPIPISSRFASKPLHSTTDAPMVPSPDYFRVLNGADSSVGVSNICDYVDNRGVKEVWLWFYHTEKVVPNESNMAPRAGGDFGSPGFEDISNSMIQDDLPRCAKSYTVYDFNYNRDVTLHNYGHQLEFLFTKVDPLVFGSFTRPFGDLKNTNHCGTVHNPPNVESSKEYIYNSTVQVRSDCQNWKPDGTGIAEIIDCHAWAGSNCTIDAGGSELAQRIWWMQNMPGKKNGLTHNGLEMPNWWNYVANFDTLVGQKPTISFQSLGSGRFVSGNVDFTVNTSPDVQRVEFYRGIEPTPFAVSTAVPFKAFMDSTKIQDGGGKIRAVAYSSSSAFGNKESAEISIDVQNVPEVAIASPVLGGTYTDSSVPLSFSIKKATPNSFSYSVDGKFPVSVNITSGAFSTKLKLTDGEHFITLFSNNGPDPDYEYRFWVNVDSDKDGFGTDLENYMGTDPNLNCGISLSGQSAWPPDFNNDKKVNSADQQILAKNFASLNSLNYAKRYDLNMDRKVNSIDQLILAKKIGQTCVSSNIILPLVIPPVASVSCQYNSAGGTYSIGDTFSVLAPTSYSVVVLLDASNKIFMFQVPSLFNDNWNKDMANYVKHIPSVVPGQYKVGLLTSDSNQKICAEQITVK